MNHPAESMWKALADDQLSDQDREWAFDHLAECDECLSIYIELMASLDTVEELNPLRADELTDLVMERVGDLPRSTVEAPSNPTGNRRRVIRSGSRRQKVLHGIIAVCCMLVLMSAGVFDRLADQPNHWRAERNEPEHKSLTTAIMKKTTSVIGALVEKPVSHHPTGKEQ
ncbi:hypothetical protein [Paenibacillus spongiae]|uniref:Zf-HC2 domain-containing protein n=1 Tax=Paenibacillus spongiae TaxID=2909671 RepID=A0ABY5S7K3_9BACL|nr:hypothetical protein [Paenibacillus spongiae]UVI29906.1 hypothetical protein L1F29_31740 [Paenibacillus spongiae]